MVNSPVNIMLFRQKKPRHMDKSPNEPELGVLWQCNERLTALFDGILYVMQRIWRLLTPILYLFYGIVLRLSFCMIYPKNSERSIVRTDIAIIMIVIHLGPLIDTSVEIAPSPNSGSASTRWTFTWFRLPWSHLSIWLTLLFWHLPQDLLCRVFFIIWVWSIPIFRIRSVESESSSRTSSRISNSVSNWSFRASLILLVFSL